MKILGERLKRLIKEKGLTQKKLAERMGVEPNTFTRWVNGNRNPDIEALKTIAYLLDTTSSYLIGETDSSESMVQRMGRCSSPHYSEQAQIETTLPDYDKKSSKKSDGGLTLDESSITLILEYLYCRLKRDHEQMAPEDLKEALEKLYKCTDYLANSQQKIKTA